VRLEELDVLINNASDLGPAPFAAIGRYGVVKTLRRAPRDECPSALFSADEGAALARWQRQRGEGPRSRSGKRVERCRGETLYQRWGRLWREQGSAYFI